MSTIRTASTRLIAATAIAVTLGAGSLAPALASSLEAPSTPATTAPAAYTVDPNSAIGKYYAAHQETLGKPLSTFTSTASGPNYQLFQGGRVVALYTGPFTVTPEFDKVFRAQGGLTGKFGEPVDEQALVNGSYRQNFRDIHYFLTGKFEDANALDWHLIVKNPQTGEVRWYTVSGRVNPLYQKLGGTDSGVMGYPTANANTSLPNGGVAQHFEHGVIYSSGPAAPIHAVKFGPIYDAYTKHGGPRGSWGYPVEEATVQADGTTVQKFEHVQVQQKADGSVTVAPYSVTYSALTDRDAVVQAANLGRFVSSGGGVIFGQSLPYYENGTLYTTKQGTKVAMSHQVLNAYSDTLTNHDHLTGRSPLGYPVSFTVDSQKGLITNFEHGSMYYDTKTQQVVTTTK